MLVISAIILIILDSLHRSLAKHQIDDPENPDYCHIQRCAIHFWERSFLFDRVRGQEHYRTWESVYVCYYQTKLDPTKHHWLQLSCCPRVLAIPIASRITFASARVGDAATPLSCHERSTVFPFRCAILKRQGEDFIFFPGCLSKYGNRITHDVMDHIIYIARDGLMSPSIVSELWWKVSLTT